MPKNLTYDVVDGDFSSNVSLALVDEETIRSYLDTQRDPVVGTQTGRCRFVEGEEKWIMQSSLPIAMDFPKDDSALALQWEDVAENESQGNALWKYSVGFLPTLYEASSSSELVDGVLDSLWEYTKSEEWKERAKWMTSLDHCIAVRLRALGTLLLEYQLDSVPVPDSLINIIGNDVVNMLLGGDDYFPVNNHGAMAAISLLHMCALCPSLLSEAEKISGKNALAVASEELSQILEDIFDEHGIAAENSPEYQRYWVSLLQPLLGLYKMFPSLEEESKGLGVLSLDTLEKIVRNAEESLRLFVDGEGKFLAIGDTHPRKQKEKGPSSGRLISEKLGFAVYREGDTIFTLNCGSTNYAHKHCDDASITLGFRGINLLLDSGYYSHDWNDPKTIYTKSQNAHSGLFMTGLDNIHPGKLYWPGRERIVASLRKVADSPFHVKGEVVIDEQLTLTREVRIEGPTGLDIVDSVSGVTSEYGRPVRRFIVPLGSKLSFEKNYVSIEKEGVRLEIIFESISTLSAVSLSVGQETPEYKGWVSPELNTLVAAQCLEIPMEVGVPSVTRLRLSEIC